MIHSFGAAGDGSVPLAGLAIGPGEVLYGTTQQGGTSSAGTVFSLAPPADPGGPWSEAVPYSFTGAGNDGFGPTAPVVIGGGGLLYGTTSQSGGTEDPGIVFSVTPPAAQGDSWIEAVLYSFPAGTGGAPEGRNPAGVLTIGPNYALFGATEQGGSAYRGTVFLLRP
ncbi:MAG: choice-of-anchor tandem repeat GloVer-containing protein [Bryobacteraceae bacterium]